MIYSCTNTMSTNYTTKNSVSYLQVPYGSALSMLLPTHIAPLRTVPNAVQKTCSKHCV
jgi:hypothetical protein